ncbi:hypothetical protein [Ulvibacterium marinum]|uniref:Uncharacterized protein n=1 Tax=Ulvibacterium marinum TaxID=2419782 RepID=A0A3B0CEM7_9FLAO|nr:hypothetical protein [Ulvibacterium marinum]RKN83581.1 hypothetical protein D7Z94_07140 [Ulvibacterium marinum]
MSFKRATLSIAIGLLFANGILAHRPEKEFDINSITYIEEEAQVDLGFDTADYLPEGFDPYTIYFDLNSVSYMEEEGLPQLEELKIYLPADFDAYADPSSVEGINYMDSSDDIEMDFETAEYLPESFNVYQRK